MPSLQGKEIFNRISKFLSNGEKRTIILSGEPGTGKTEMAKYISNLVGGYTLVLDVDGINMRHVKMCQELSPRVLIVDDFDVKITPHEALSCLEKLKESIPLVILTMNQPDSLDSAAVRAGRVDDTFVVSSVRTPQEIVPGLSEDQYERVEGWPAAFLEELRKRLAILGAGAFDDEWAKLNTRREKNEEYNRPPKVGPAWKD